MVGGLLPLLLESSRYIFVAEKEAKNVIRKFIIKSYILPKNT